MDEETKETQTKETKELQLSPEEQKAIAQRRDMLDKISKVEDEIIKILKSNNANLVIDPNSPYGNPRIVVNLL